LEGYLIDPFERQIHVVAHDDTIENILAHLQCRAAVLVPINSTGDSVFVDENGLACQPKRCLTGNGSSR